mmetsp:Transcript_15528/g.32844  ORF Transcript_15528/g.32844 Transcript_15528/m.32844 type:complete len:377 (+) Transcript_15528:853-1983(+)
MPRPNQTSLGVVWRAVLADALSVAGTLPPLVVLAGLVADALRMNVRIGTSRVSTSTRAAAMTVDQDLRGEAHLRPRAVVLHSQAIGQRRGDTVGPTTCTVRRVVLVRIPSCIAPPRNIGPIPPRRQVARGQVFVRPPSSDELAPDLAPVAPHDTAGAESRHPWLRGGSISGRRGFNDGHLLPWVVLCNGICSGIRTHVSPLGLTMVARGGPGALRLDGNGVAPSSDPRPAIVAPVAAPGVAEDPVILPVVSAVTNHTDDVVNVHVMSRVLKDTLAKVGGEGVRGGDLASDGATLQLRHHLLLSAYYAVLIDAEDLVLLPRRAAMLVAVPADVLRLAATAGVAALRLVALAGFLRDASALLDEAVGGQWVTPIASLV